MFPNVRMISEDKNRYAHNRTQFRDWIDPKSLPSTEEERKLLQDVNHADIRFNITKTECLLMAFLYGEESERTDRDLQVDTLLTDLAHKKIKVEAVMQSRYSE